MFAVGFINSGPSPQHLDSWRNAFARRGEGWPFRFGKNVHTYMSAFSEAI